MNITSNNHYGQVKQGLRFLGYEGNLLQEEYGFADILGPIYSVRTIPLATFAQDPPSYQNACFGVVISDGQTGIRLVSSYRSLGAPHIIEIRQNEIHRWKMTSQGDPKWLEVISPERIRGMFESHKQDWSPDQILRAKSMGEEDFAAQLDFFDVGLLPLINGEVQEKLDSLLRRTVLIAVEQYKSKYPNAEPDYPGLVRLLFRLIAAKILNDRNYPGNWLNEDPGIVVKAVEDFYFREATPKPVLEDYATQLVAWNSIKSAFYFQNLSVEALAHVYENTFVSKELRTLYSIHGTPPYIAEYIVRHLPFDKLEDCERIVFEPFAGHAVFLVAAMRRLRELLPSSMGAEERHEYFIQRLSGIEKEEFAWEVGRLSLMLADYPNPNGWRLTRGDAFQDSIFDREIARAGIVLCNPPFEDFTIDERGIYANLTSVHKPIEILRRIVTHPQRPPLLGFVLPRTFITGQAYRELRETVGSTYSRLELVALPDKVFRHSDAEAVLLLAEGEPAAAIHITSALVDKDDLPIFRRQGTATYTTERDVPTDSMTRGNMLWEPPLSQVWDRLSSYERFGNIAEIHRGIEYTIPLRPNREKFVSSHPREGFEKGLDMVREGFEPYISRDNVFLNVGPDEMRTNAYLHHWNKPKVVANATRISRGPWRIAAVPDYEGLVCYQNFHGIWSLGRLPIEVLAAILNTPVANAYLWTHARRSNEKTTIGNVPVPNLDAPTTEILTNLVRTYIRYRQEWLANPFEEDRARDACYQLLAEIDAVILRAYDLPPKLERQLLDCFRGHSRPVPVEFTGYYPLGFKPFIPWHKYISNEFQRARIDETLARIPVIDDPSISEALSEL
ncbi:MAG: hypothetical protein ISS52_01595 [Dehalococcoidia bacterium]|nr:hypothetical protein [Dehalococcoidia bacterium]